MSILTKAKNMTAKKGEQRYISGTVNDRGYDVYKIINGLVTTLGVTFLGMILAVVMNTNVLVGKHDVRLDNQDVRTAKVENRFDAFSIRFEEHALRDAQYQNNIK